MDRPFFSIGNLRHHQSRFVVTILHLPLTNIYQKQSKEKCKNQTSIQSRTISDPENHNGKVTRNKKKQHIPENHNGKVTRNKKKQQHIPENHNGKVTRNRKHIPECQEGSPFPIGDHKAARNRQDSMNKTNTSETSDTKKRSTKEAPPWNSQ